MKKDNELLVEIGKRIQEARISQKMSQDDLANKISISTPYLSKIESGKASCSISIFFKLVEALQVSADWLLRADTSTGKNIVSSEIDELLKDKSIEDIEKIKKLIKDIF